MIKQYILGSAIAEKTGDFWSVSVGTQEIAAGLKYSDAKRLVHIEDKKSELGKFKLAMNFIPDSCKNINLHKNLLQSEWSKIAKDTYLKANGACEICKTSWPRLDCHEVWIYDDCKHIQKLNKLISICTTCHRAIHFNSVGLCLIPMEKYDKVIEHFLNVNKVDQAAMDRHEAIAKSLLNQRNEHEWSVDFGSWTEIVENSDRRDLEVRKHSYKIDKTNDGIVFNCPKSKTSGHVLGKSIEDFFDVTYGASNDLHKIIRAAKTLTCALDCKEGISKGSLYATRGKSRQSIRACYNCLLEWQDESALDQSGFMGPEELTCEQETAYFLQKAD